jgi:hypothetical protein
MDTVAQNVPPTMAALVTQTLSSYLANNLGMDVISKDDVRNKVGLEKLQQITGCDSGACSGASSIGNALAVEKIMTSTLGKIGDNYQISVVVMDTSTSTVTGRGTREIRSEDEIVENARDLAHFAMKNEQRESKGYVRVSVRERNSTNTMTGAQIVLDGSPYGVSPLSTPIRVLAGKHAVHVEKEGFFAFDGFVKVEIGAEASLEVTLIPTSTGGSGLLPWAGATAGVAVVGGVVSIVSYYHALDICKKWGLDSKACGTAGQSKPLLLSEKTAYEKDVNLYGNQIAFYGGIGSAVIGGVSVVLFSAYFITNNAVKKAGGGGDVPAVNSPFKLEPTADGFALRF